MEKVQALKARHRIFSTVRTFFDVRDFTEIHTPLLVPNPGMEPHLIPFETKLERGMGGGRDEIRYLPTSPEYHLKKALAMGFPRVYEISRSFRNGEWSRTHEPEFHMLEWYRYPGAYTDIARDFRELMTELGAKFAPDEPWAKAKDLRVHDAFREYCDGMDLEGALAGRAPSLTEQAIARGFASVRANFDFETAFNLLIVERIEPRLGYEGPVFLWDYPASLCALARVKPENPLCCERFEVYWQGIELANAFGELTDPVEQRRRCLEDYDKRLKLYGKSPPLDESFLQALGSLRYPAGGIAVGLDRLVQCLLKASTLQQVIAFPHADSL